jgi:predicted PurR-regulated permease PerM
MTPTASPEKLQKIVLLILVGGITLLFLWMIRQFLVALLVAAILSAMFQPLYGWLVRRFRGRRRLASATTIGIVLLLVVVPLTAFLGIVAAQAVQLSEEVRPWVERQLSRTPELGGVFDRLPFADAMRPYRDQILSKAGELAGHIGTFAVGILTAAARGTALFFILLFVMLYAMFFFLVDGKAVLDKILFYLPLRPEEEALMMGRFVSVSRATIKGSLVIGLVQGALGGLAFWMAGLEGWAFWLAVMAVLSVIPGLGAAIVWIPAVIYLGIVGRWAAAALFVIWFALLVGSVDNFLRPMLIGKDTKLPDLLILLSTLGGIVLFGAVGVLIGPIVAALFVTVWDLYGTAFRDILPPVEHPVLPGVTPARAPSAPPSPPPPPPPPAPPRPAGPPAAGREGS